MRTTEGNEGKEDGGRSGFDHRAAGGGHGGRKRRQESTGDGGVEPPMNADERRFGTTRTQREKPGMAPGGRGGGGGIERTPCRRARPDFFKPGEASHRASATNALSAPAGKLRCAAVVTEKQQPPPVELYGSRERHPKSSTRAERSLVHRHLRFPTSTETLSCKAQPS